MPHATIKIGLKSVSVFLRLILVLIIYTLIYNESCVKTTYLDYEERTRFKNLCLFMYLSNSMYKVDWCDNITL